MRHEYSNADAGFPAVVLTAIGGSDALQADATARGYYDHRCYSERSDCECDRHL